MRSSMLASASALLLATGPTVAAGHQRKERNIPHDIAVAKGRHRQMRLQQQQRHRRTEVEFYDATSHFEKSTESTFDHMVTLEDTSAQGLTFHWNDVVGNTVTCRLVHTSKSSTTEAGWLGFGIYAKTGLIPPGPTDPLMVGSDAVIGVVNDKTVKKFHLGDKKAGPGGVEAMPENRQTLITENTHITQHDGDDGSVTTVVTFEKLLEEAEVDEAKIKHADSNTFLWAIGGKSEPGDGLAFHMARGAFTLDFKEVETRAERGFVGKDEEDPDTRPKDETYTEDEGDGEDQDPKKETPIVRGTCESDDVDFDRMVQLTPELHVHWSLNDDSEGGAPESVSIKLKYQGNAWVALGISKDGNMIGSEAIIGLPDEAITNGAKPMKYALRDKATASIVPLESQTLTDHSVTQENGETVLTFTKILDEGDSLPLLSEGFTTFIYAIGSDNTFSYHQHRGSFELDLGTCETGKTDTGAASTTKSTGGAASSHMGVWAAHGTFATLAWAVAAPFAVTTAWFRTLVPSSWIYIHVFANVSTFCLTLVTFIIAVVGMSISDNPAHFSETHHWIGLVMLLFVTFQVMNGFLRPPVEKRDPYGSHQDEYEGWFSHLTRSPRAMWHLAHRSTGVGLIAFGIFQIQDGLNMFSADFNTKSLAPVFWVYVGIFAAMLVGLKLWIVYEEYKARKGMEAVTSVDQRRMGNMAAGTGIDPDSELVPVQFDMH